MTQYEPKEQTRDPHSPKTGKSDVEEKKSQKEQKRLKMSQKYPKWDQNWLKTSQK